MGTNTFAGIQPISMSSAGGRSGSGFYDATGGLNLKTPSVVGEYQSGNFNIDAYNPDFDSFFEKLLNDTTGKYIGAVPPIGQNPKWKTQQPASPSKFGTAMQTIGSSPVTSQVLGGIDQMVQAGGNMRRNEYENDLRYWQEQGKYWFDPNADIKPDLEQYLNMMPSALESRGVGGDVMNMVTQTAQGAATGAQMGGGWGALAGGGTGLLLGTFQTIFGRKAAREEDEKNRARAIAQYEKDLKEWTVRRLKRQKAESEARYQKQKADREARRDKEKVEEFEKGQRVGQRRQQLAQVILSAGKLSEAGRRANMERWRR